MKEFAKITWQAAKKAWNDFKRPFLIGLACTLAAYTLVLLVILANLLEILWEASKWAR